jgi:hypothetical protein
MKNSMPIKVQELLNARFCHDLANSLGTLQLSVDHLLCLEKKKLKENDLARYNTLDLIQRATKTSLGKHQLYRFAYGNPSALEGITFGEIAKIIDKFNVETSFVFVSLSDESVLTGESAKLFLNLYLLSAEIIPFGGTITANHQKDHLQMMLDAEYKQIPDLNIINEEDLTSKNIQLYYVKFLHDSLDRKIMIENQDEQINIISK